MAQLSSHPYIVTIYEADVTDDGHSYLAMEYCSRPSLDVALPPAPLGVDEVLALGIQVASAVETAHRAGIAAPGHQAGQHPGHATTTGRR